MSLRLTAVPREKLYSASVKLRSRDRFLLRALGGGKVNTGLHRLLEAARPELERTVGRDKPKDHNHNYEEETQEEEEEAA